MMLQIFYMDIRTYNYSLVIKILDDPIDDINISGFNHVGQVFKFRAIQGTGVSGKGVHTVLLHIFEVIDAESSIF